MTCHGFSTPGTRALCQTELTLNTQWHKTAQTSSIVGSFFADADKLMLNPPILTMVDPVVTGTTGAWGKVDNIQSVSLSQIGTTGKYYKLTIGYKVRPVVLDCWRYNTSPILNRPPVYLSTPTGPRLEPRRRLLSGFLG